MYVCVCVCVYVCVMKRGPGAGARCGSNTMAEEQGHRGTAAMSLLLLSASYFLLAACCLLLLAAFSCRFEALFFFAAPFRPFQRACRPADQRPASSRGRALGMGRERTEGQRTHRSSLLAGRALLVAGGLEASVIRCRAANFAKGPGFLVHRLCGRLASETVRWAVAGVLDEPRAEPTL
ncbi:hypothetical protein AOQ84DRAFT_423562, partial [Glonium stellatum]